MSVELVFFRVRLRVDDVALLLKSAQDRDNSLEEGCTVEDALRTLCVRPALKPVDAGYEILARTEVTARAQVNHYQLVVNARVFDQDRAVAEAKSAYISRWSNQSWEPDGLDEAVYHMVLASNPNPAPHELGFEIMGWDPLNYLLR